MIRVVVTGSECTGKTTLAGALAEHYGTVWTQEHVRDFVARRGAVPTSADVSPIAHGQVASERDAAYHAKDLLILDTDLLSTIVYSRHYYGTCPEWIETELRANPGDLYLLAGIDVPWTPDGIYRDRGDRREEMQALFREALVSRDLRFVDVSGPHEKRMKTAVQSIDDLLNGGKSPTHPFSTQRRKSAKTQSPLPPDSDQ